MFKLLQLGLLVAATSAAWIGEEYWSIVGYDGYIKEGRTTADFINLDDLNSGNVDNGWVAYWITRTKYGEKHYEAFGHAFIREDRRICAWFVGLEKEVVEVCGGFRVLSKSTRNPREQSPFKWVPARDANRWNTIGYHGHRIGKLQNKKHEAFYGDAQLAAPRFRVENNFQGVNPMDTEQGIVNIENPTEFNSHVWLLAKTTPDQPPERTSSRDSHSPWTYEERLAAHNRMIEEQRQRRQEEQRIREHQLLEQERYNTRHRADHHNAAGHDGHPANRAQTPSEGRENSDPFIVTADGTVYDISVLPNDPRLKDPRSHSDDSRYDERFDPRSRNYDGRYNPYDDNFDPTTDPRFRAKYPDYVHIPRGRYYPRNGQQNQYPNNRYNQYDRPEGREPLKTRPTSDSEKTAPSVPNSNLHMVRILRPGDVRGVKVVDNDGTVYNKRIENGREVYYADPHSHVPNRGPPHRSNMLTPSESQNAPSSAIGAGAHPQGSHVVDQRYQDPNYVNMHTALHDRVSGTSQSAPEVGQGSVPNGYNGNHDAAKPQMGQGVQPAIVPSVGQGANVSVSNKQTSKHPSMGNGTVPSTNSRNVEDEDSEMGFDYNGHERVAPPKPVAAIDSAELHEDPEDEEEDALEERF